MNTHTCHTTLDPLNIMGHLDLRQPYGLSVLIKGTTDQRFAEECAPLVARIEYPTRKVGAVLWSEQLGHTTFEVVVTDLGPTPKGTQP